MCSSSVPLLSSLQLHPDEEGGQWVWFENLVCFLRENHVPNDKPLRTSNILRELRGHLNGVKTVGHKQTVSFPSVLRYIFNHSDDYKICKRICNQIEASITKGVVEHAATSIFELYKVIAKTNLKSATIEKLLMPSLLLDETQIPSLHHVYKSDFTQTDWQKICLFEWHFSKEHSTENATYDEEVKQRWDFLNSYRTLCRMSVDLYTQSKRLILQQLKRKAAAEVKEGIQIAANLIHVPSVIGVSLLEVLHEHFDDVAFVVCVDCVVGVCKHPPSIHVYIELTHDDISMVENISTIVCGHLESKHSEYCSSVIFFSPGAFAPYRGTDNSVQRFHLRDAIYCGHMKDKIVYNWQTLLPANCQSEFENSQPCQNCHNHVMENPLDWKKVDITKEWLLEVPLGIQAIMESFINKDSLRKTSEKEKFLKAKIARLYTTLDSLLNVLNRQYSGVLQDLNTEQLALNFHNVTTVFSITSRGGTSRSLSSAEKHIRNAADLDKCYFNTYIREYPIKYTNMAGIVVEKLSLRDCYLVLCLDNLVRLTFHEDPVPGESRSSQLCTLPITVKGLAKDAKVIEDWHDNSVCDGTMTCVCKDSKQLSNEDVKPALLQLTDKEEEAKLKFNSLCTWGTKAIWTTIEKSEISNLIEEAIRNKPTVQNETLNESFRALAINSADIDMEHCSSDEECMPNDNKMFLEDNGEQDIEVDSNSSELSDSEANSECDIQELLADVSICGDDEIKDFKGQTSDSDAESDDFSPLQTSLTELSETTLPFQANMSAVASEGNGSAALPGKFTCAATEVTDNVQDTHNHSDVNAEDTSVPFIRYVPPPLLCRHPPPAIGRDDDIIKLKAILDDVLLKGGYAFGITEKCKDRILFAPDHNIANNLIKLMRNNEKYQTFLPEFPLLHLCKSKITNICSGYKDAGLLHLFKYMRDDDQQNDWSKLVSAQNIDAATRMIKRVGFALHLAFMISFIKSLPPSEAESLTNDLKNQEQQSVMQEWGEKYDNFMTSGTNQNATFALHKDIMKHCDEVGAIAFAERLGEPQGYQLLLSSVKSSLPFSFLNGASSYASFCTHLLYEHSRAGIFYQNLKECLFSTPYKDSNVNFGLDTQWEMEHKDALKSFRPRATVKAVLPRMSLVDTLNDIHESSSSLLGHEEDSSVTAQSPPEPAWIKITSTDCKYIYRTAAVILRRNGICLDPDPVPHNVYDKGHTPLSEMILDHKSYEIGEFLIQKYVCQQELFGLTADNCPDVNEVQGPKELLSKIKRGKSVTIRRMKIKPNAAPGSEQQSKEMKRQKKVATEKKIVDCLSSEMNTCQAVVKADCSKSSVQKSTGIKNAVLNILDRCCKGLYTEGEETEITKNSKSQQEEIKKMLSSHGLAYMEIKSIPETVAPAITIAIVEFAGVKFKAFAVSGKEYLKYIENGVIKSMLRQASNIQHLVICEKKYTFTPDDFKAATRAKRQGKNTHSVVHLKVGSEMLSFTEFDKAAIITTSEGKSLISSFLAKNIEKLNIKSNLIIDVDSEHYLEGCICSEFSRDPCHCELFTTPIRATFNNVQGYIQQEKLPNIQQRKGEAEMAQADWLQDCMDSLKERDAVLQFVTSGDVDAVIIQLFAVSLYWPKRLDGTFKNPVYVLLQKPGSFDLYNITGIIEVLVKYFGDEQIGVKLAFILCMGGNDYLPKYHGISHDKMTQTIINSEHFLKNLFQLNFDQKNSKYIGGYVNKEVYKEVLKNIYCPRTWDADKLTFAEVRQMTIKLPNQSTFRSPQLWLPPASALEKLAQLVDYQIEYLFTVMDPLAKLPNFLSKGCLQKTKSGEIEYNLGPDSHTENKERLLELEEASLMERMQQAKRKQVRQKSVKRTHEETPQKGRRRKLGPKTSTPKKLNNDGQCDFIL